MKIRVNGIFDKYNNEVDLDRKCTIFIGENGVGKSTTMKIVNAFLSGNFVELLKYYFDSIEVYENDKIIFNVQYEELFPKVEDILELTKYAEPKENNEFKYLELNPNTIYDHYDEFLKFINNNPTCYKHLVRTSLNEYTNFSYEGFKKQYNVKTNSLYDFSFLIVTFYYRIVNIVEYGKVKFLDDTIFSNKEYYKNVNDIIDKYKNVFLISSVKELNISNDVFKIATKYCTKNDEYRILDSYKEKEKRKLITESRSGKSSEYLDKEKMYVSIDEAEIYLRELFDKHGLDFVINNTKIDNIYKDYNVYYDLMGKYNDDKKSSIDLQKLLFKYYYSDEVINKFNKDYYTMLKKMIYREYSEEELELDNYLDIPDVINKINLFIMPLIPMHSFYRYFMYGNNKDKYKYEYRVFNKFIHDNLDYYVNGGCDKVKKLNSLFSEYFKSKKIYCSPNGLIISDKIDYDNRYSIKYLSEGETRIIILLMLSIFNDNNILLIDEPETSLSVIWQQRLIKDILDNGKIDNLMVSTQSPFIVDDDALMDYVTCLPYDIRGDSYEN